MFLSLKRLYCLGLVTITKNGELNINCCGLSVTNANYNGRQCRVINGYITIRLPPHQNLAVEMLSDQDIGLVIEINPAKSHDKRVKAGTGLTSAPKHATVPAPVLEDGFLAATICVATSHVSKLPEGAKVTATKSGCTIAEVSVIISDVLIGDHGLLLESTGLAFAFHRDISEEATDLLQKAREAAAVAEGQANIKRMLQRGLDAVEKDSQSRTNAGASCVKPVTSTDANAYSAFGGQRVASPVPIFCEDLSSGVWADDDERVLPPASPAPASPALLPREKEATAFSGALENVGFRNEKKPTKAQKKEAERLAKLAEAQRQAELDKAKRLENEAKENAFREESIRIELAHRRMKEEEEEEQRRRESLGAEYDAVQSFIRAHLGITREQFIASPDNCRARIAELQNSAQQEEEKSAIPVPYVTIHTPNKSYMEGLCRQADALGIKIVIYQSGKHWCADITADDMQMLNVFRWNQHMWISTKQGGYKVQVGRDSYQALMKIRPDVASIVQEAMELQDQLDHRKQGLVSQPYCPQYYQYHAMGASPFVIVPVLDIHGNVMCLQQVSRYA
jgi:hypothetical protein